MRYVNARDVFPKSVLAAMQQYADGVYIYIPRKENNRKQWGENTQTKTETRERNDKIYTQYKLGAKIGELAEEHFCQIKASKESLLTEIKITQPCYNRRLRFLCVPPDSLNVFTVTCIRYKRPRF
jgi:hypothetical protein